MGRYIIYFSSIPDLLKNKNNSGFQLKEHHENTNAPSAGLRTLSDAVLIADDAISLNCSNMSKPDVKCFCYLTFKVTFSHQAKKCPANRANWKQWVMPSVAVLVYSMKSSQWRPAVKRAVIVLQGKQSPPILELLASRSLGVILAWHAGFEPATNRLEGGCSVQLS